MPSVNMEFLKIPAPPKVPLKNGLLKRKRKEKRKRNPKTQNLRSDNNYE